MKKALLFVPILLNASSAIAADSVAVLKLFEEKCAECHSEGDATPTLTQGINLTSLLASEDDVKSILDRVGRADQAKGRMPKSKGKPGDPGYVAPLNSEEIALLRAWAAGDPKPAPSVATSALANPTGAAPPTESGAPDKTNAETTPGRTFLSLREEVRMIAEDLEKQSPSAQAFTRYLTLTNLANLRDEKGKFVTDERQMDTYRAAISKLLNSLSLNGVITVPVAVDPGRTIYRFDLRHYRWSQQQWEDHVVKVYPYALRGVDARREADIAQISQSRSAWVRADWFTFAASQAPLYLKLLQLPDNDREIEKQLGVDVNTSLREGRAVRAGFRESGVSQGNRMIERHEIGRYSGAYWKSYDFSPLQRGGKHDLFRSPLGPQKAGLTQNADLEFAHDGGEIIWNLPNGLQAYYLSTAAGKRLDRAPTEIVQDNRRRDGAILNGISCMACHDQGMKSLKVDDFGKETAESLFDEVGPVALAAGLDKRDAQLVRDLYAPQSRLLELIRTDEARFQEACAKAMPGFDAAKDPIITLYNRFKATVKAQNLAAEFGEEDGKFLERLKSSRNQDLEVIAAQLEAGLGFPRASWIDQFKTLARALNYQLLDFQPLDYAEFTNGAPKAGGNEGQAVLPEGGRLTIKTDKSHYMEDELLTVSLKLTEASFVRLYHLSAEKKVTQIFPNGAQTDNFVRGGKLVQIGSQKQGALAAGEFRFRMGKPFGSEIILAVASPVQFTDEENLKFASGEAFKQFTQEHDLNVAARRGTKGLTVETQDATGKVTGERSAGVISAHAVFTVGPK